MDVLLTALQATASTSREREYSVLVVDVTPIVDLQNATEDAETHSFLLAEVKTPSYSHTSASTCSEWLQALIQYLHTAGFRGVMANSWQEVQQQVQKQSVDLILICLEESYQALSVLRVLTELGQQHKLPPVLVMERRFSQSEVKEQFPHSLGDGQESIPTYGSDQSKFGERILTQTDRYVKPASVTQSDTLMSLETILGGIATKILPSTLSMEELLDNIHQTLVARG